jgi:hypothetical protein
MDRGSAALRRLLLSRCDLDTLIGFENLKRIFPVHRSIRFVLLSATSGRPTGSVACRFGLTDPAELEALADGRQRPEPWFPVQLRRESIERLSGADLSFPWIRRSTDFAIADRAAALFPPLGSADGWSIAFGRDLNATEDRALFRQAREGLRVIDGRHVTPFAVDVGAGRWRVDVDAATSRLPHRGFARPRLAYRDVASPTNRLTLIAALLPAGCVSTHTLFCLRTALPLADQHLLCGFFNSYVVNFLVRLRVSTHVTTAIVERLPIPRRREAPAAARQIAALARLLGRRSDPTLSARLQASVARLYQLTWEEFEYVVSGFPLVPAAERRAALECFAAGPAATTKRRTRHG